MPGTNKSNVNQLIDELIKQLEAIKLESDLKQLQSMKKVGKSVLIILEAIEDES